MQMKSAVLGMVLAIGLLLGNLAVPGIAAQGDTEKATLPRSFQGARLGMTLSELTAAVPDAKRVSLNRRDQAQRTVVMPSKDHAIQRVEYRFYNDRLRELAIYYTYGEVPGGFERLRERLQETYGEPAVIDQTEYDSSPNTNIVSVKKTVWKDHATMSVLSQSHKMYQGRELYDLILTITDFDLQQRFEQEQEQRRRQEELKVPIPLPDSGIQNKQTAMSRMAGTHM